MNDTPATNGGINTNTDASSSVSIPSATTSSTFPPICTSAYACGQDNLALKQRVDSLEARINKLCETSAEKREYYRLSKSLVQIYRVILISLPIAIIAIIGIIQYLSDSTDNVWSSVITVIGLVAVAECIFLPMGWKKMNDKINELDEKINNINH